MSSLAARLIKWDRESGDSDATPATAADPAAERRAEANALMTSNEMDETTATVAGTRSEAVIDEILTRARGEIEAWLAAVTAACQASGDRANPVLAALTASRSREIRQGVKRMSRLSVALRGMDTLRVKARADRAAAIVQRDAAMPRRYRERLKAADDLSVRLMEMERRRAEVIGEIARLTGEASVAAKTLYAQIAVLTRSHDTQPEPVMHGIEPGVVRG